MIEVFTKEREPVAQLIKLQDYISRYEMDPKRYPTQYIRLKQSKWQRMKDEWEENPDFESTWEDVEEQEQERLPQTIFQKINPFKRKKKEMDYDELLEESVAPIASVAEEKKEEDEEELAGFNFEPSLLYRPQSLVELHKMYMDQLFGFQLNWASTTMREKSNMDQKYQRDELLKDLLQKLPDTFFVLYEPIILVKKAPVELGVVILTPTECYCIQLIEAEERATFTGNHSDRFWLKRVGEQTKNIVNPLIGLNRMEGIMKSIFEQNQVEMNIRKIMLSRNGYIDYPGSSFGLEFVDRRHYTNWFEQLKKHHSPMKLEQFRAMEAMVKHTQTTAVLRAEWFTEGGEK